MPWRLENMLAVIATALVFAFCGWLIAGSTGAGFAALAVCAILFFMQPVPSERAWQIPLAVSPARAGRKTRRRG
jgi:uncharacterized membrane protein YfcA